MRRRSRDSRCCSQSSRLVRSTVDARDDIPRWIRVFHFPTNRLFCKESCLVGPMVVDACRIGSMTFWGISLGLLGMYLIVAVVSPREVVAVLVTRP
jgi:hypothetical protein